MAAPPTVVTHAPQPAPPERQFSFTDFQTNNPSAPLPADRLDGEIDRSNEAIEDVIVWAATSLNTDGSLKPQSVGKAQLAPGLFDGIVEPALAEVTPYILEAKSAAQNAIALANEADASALAAATQNAAAQDASGRASTDAEDAANSAAEAAQSALEAAASATAASDHAGHALGSEHLAEDWSWVSVEWAEHMPDTIPPNILATNGITGEHWSSRWWAHRAGEIVLEGQQEIVCAIEAYWLGAHPTPPTLDSCGKPIAPGAMYFDTAEGVTKVLGIDGLWHNVVQPVPGSLDEYLYLPASPTTVFTGVDARGNPLVLDPSASEVGVYLNGVKLLEGYDYSLSANTVTFTLGSVTTPNTVEIVVVGRPPATAPMPNGLKINTGLWAFDGVTKTFPLKDSNGNTVTPPSAIDCIVSLNGVIQEGGGAFTVRPGFIDFVVPPEADADRWMVVGLGGSGGPGTMPTRAMAGQATSGLLIPYYLPPNDPYLDVNTQRLLGLMRQYHDVGCHVVLNPADGPGAAMDANYANFIKLLKAAGGRVYGYVATGFGTRPAPDVTADIEKWRSFYGLNPVDGIFLDEQSWDTGPGNSGTAYVDLYKSYTDYCHARGLRTIANPGTNQQPAYFSTYTADVIIVHENLNYPPEADMAGNYIGGHADYSYTRRAALVYNQPSLVSASLQTLRKYVQLLYVTDDNLTAGALNPWDALPTYLEQLFAALSEGGATMALQARIDDLELRLTALETAP